MAESLNAAGGMFGSLPFYPPADNYWRRVFHEWGGPCGLGFHMCVAKQQYGPRGYRPFVYIKMSALAA
jgi:hypothetical protein